MIQTAIPSHIRSQTIAVNGARMHYLETGAGDPIVFLHGNPTSSYLWRNVIPHLETRGRCIAVDCIGMGQSDKPALAYRLVDHIAYLTAFLDALALTNITLVTHDWGVVMGLYVCRSAPERVRGIAFMEGHIHPIERWDALDPGAQAMFKQLRTEQPGRAMVLEENFFIETVLPSGVKRSLAPAEMNAYRAPFGDKQARLPMWQWANEIPIEGHPADVDAIVRANQEYLASAALPKLLLYGQPGAVIGASEVAWCRENCRNLSAVDIAPASTSCPKTTPIRLARPLRAGWIPRGCRRDTPARTSARCQIAEGFSQMPKCRM